jgi:phosphoglycerol transferase MdoB-like AlkP superfamily enzyme
MKNRLRKTFFPTKNLFQNPAAVAAGATPPQAGLLARRPVSYSRLGANYPDLVFWVSYLTLNCLLFLPLYLLNQDSATFLPVSAAAAGDPVEAAERLLLWRNNLDIFRLNAEILLLLTLWVYLPWLRRSPTRRLFRWFFGLFYAIILSYALYESVMLSMYQTDPVFYSHFHLALDGLPVIFRHLRVPPGLYAMAGLGLVAGLAILAKLIGALTGRVAVERLNWWSKGSLGLLACLVILSIATHRAALASPKMAVSSFAYKLRQNIIDSIALHEQINRYDDTLAQNAYNYTGHELLVKPNIFLIFIESYGSVLYKRPDYRQAYTELLNGLQARLEENDWHVVSALSEAPTWGGGSWMSYTSTLFGLRIDTHPQYLSLRERYQTVTYPDLGHYLKSQGYEYVRLSSLAVDLEEEEWDQLKNLYGIDRWPNYDDLDFTGPHFGWGPSPPDQYALYYAYETILKKSEQPFFFFFITQNSHYPWAPLPEVVEDWRTLNESTEITAVFDPDAISHQAKRQNYLNSINYELSFLTDYIVKTEQKNSIFIIIGDHQPPQVSRRNDSFDTPVHILSRDSALVDGFLEYGFGPGLAVGQATATMRHEGFYSMFMRVLLAEYGQGTRVRPDYLPGGIATGNSVGHQQKNTHNLRRQTND